MPKLRHTKVAASRPKSAVMASLDLASFYSPGRGIGYSVVIHAVLLTVVQLLAIIHIPPPPPIPFRYAGYVALDAQGGRLTALLVDSNASRHFSVVKGETLMGRYRLLELTQAFIEGEDLEFNRRQRMPLIIQ